MMFHWAGDYLLVYLDHIGLTDVSRRKENPTLGWTSRGVRYTLHTVAVCFTFAVVVAWLSATAV